MTDQHGSRNEIAQLRHELDILRTRLAIYERWGRIVRIFLMVWIPLFVALIVSALAKVVLFDALMGGFFIVLAAIICVVIWLTVDWSRMRSPSGRSAWTDFVAPAFSPRSLAPGIPGFLGIYSARTRSDAAIIEEQIAERERRLEELELPT